MGLASVESCAAAAITTHPASTPAPATTAPARVAVLFPYTLLVFLHLVEDLVCDTDVFYLSCGIGREGFLVSQGRGKRVLQRRGNVVGWFAISTERPSSCLRTDPTTRRDGLSPPAVPSRIIV